MVNTPTKKVPPQSPKPKERRDFFRIDQELHFDFKLVDKERAELQEAEESFSDNVSLSLLGELQRMDKEHSQALRLLSEKNRLLGDYLLGLNQKIDLIARHTLFANGNQFPDKSTERINLSEDGLAFATDRALYKGNYLAVRLVFLPQYSPINVFAKVVRCENKGKTHQVAAKFHRISEHQRQELARQILKAQVRQKKRLAENTKK